MMQSRFTPRRAERGMAILLVAFVLVMVLIGGLVAVAVTSGEITSSGGYRVRSQLDTCARAAADRVAQLLPNTAAVAAATGTIGGLTFRVGHLTGTAPAVKVVPDSGYDGAALTLALGFGATNTLPGGSSGGGVQVYAVTVVCSGSGITPREMEVVVKYGVPSNL